MPIKLECPRCKKPLAVPRKKAGSYVNCPECGGRFWVPPSTEDLADGIPTDSTLPEDSVESSSVAPPAKPAAKRPRSIRQTDSRPSASEPARDMKTADTTPRNVARFVSAEAAQSPLRLAEDGKLPELMLENEAEKTARSEKGRSTNPALLIGGVALSVVFSLVLLLWDPSPVSSDDDKARARQTIRDNFFAVADDRPPVAYQQWLQEAQRAASRGDTRAERMLYQRVLEQLRTERGPFDPGLTGSRASDKELEQQIITILRD